MVGLQHEERERESEREKEKKKKQFYLLKQKKFQQTKKTCRMSVFFLRTEYST